jgi:hypothetical protein
VDSWTTRESTVPPGNGGQSTARGIGVMAWPRERSGMGHRRAFGENRSVTIVVGAEPEAIEREPLFRQGGKVLLIFSENLVI